MIICVLHKKYYGFGNRNLGLNTMTVQYLFSKANELYKTPAQIIDELVGKELAAVV